MNLTNQSVNRKTQLRVGFMALMLMAGLLQGCSSSKKLVYFQGATAVDDTIAVSKPYIPTIKAGDVLSVQVSSLNPEASAFFNTASLTTNTATTGVANPLAPTTGYLVGDDGAIKLPIIGKVTVTGLTNDQTGELISKKLAPYLKEPTVNVRNQNFRISVLGEVARPSLFTIPNERITIPEALGLAGDLTLYGRRDNVLIIREEGGKRVFTRIDMTNRNAFKSPYYSLHPNDIVYVEPGKTRAISVDRTFQLAPIFLGVLSLLAIIVTR